MQGYRQSPALRVIETHPSSAAWQPSSMDWYTARSLASLTGASMWPHASFRNSASSKKLSWPATGDIDCELTQPASPETLLNRIVRDIKSPVSPDRASCCVWEGRLFGGFTRSGT